MAHPTAELGAPLLKDVTRLSEQLHADYLEHHGVLPLGISGGVVHVATWRERVDTSVLDDLRLMFRAEPSVAVLPEHDVRVAIRRVYGTEAVSAAGIIADLEGVSGVGAERELALDDLRSMANEPPVVRLVNVLLLEALEARASDVHLEGSGDAFEVRYRIDGVLQTAQAPPAHLAAAIVSRLKIMAELDIAERRLPQDGRMRLRLMERDVDVRVSTLPMLGGESVVLRLLDRRGQRPSLGDIGMASDTLDRFSAVVRRPHGIVLVTGPTGSGKTTTLYGALELIRTGREKILTVEDPVEYELPGVCQVPVNARVGLTFASALRSLLRQDPDVLLVGEIRDVETAEIATQAALTGHLVLATLHTNNAPGALTRLLDLGIPEYLVASTVEAVLAQRLVRLNCTDCLAAVSGDGEGDRGPGGCAAPGSSRSAGCAACRGTGFRGRTGIYELLIMTDELRALVSSRPATAEIARCAAAAGMRTLREDGLRQVRAGRTTPAEIARVTVF